jgi:hypothetical protein
MRRKSYKPEEIVAKLRQVVGTTGVPDHVAKRPEHGEGIATLQDPGPRLTKRTGSLDAVLGVVVAALCRRY